MKYLTTIVGLISLSGTGTAFQLGLWRTFSGPYHKHIVKHETWIIKMHSKSFPQQVKGNLPSCNSFFSPNQFYVQTWSYNLSNSFTHSNTKKITQCTNYKHKKRHLCAHTDTHFLSTVKVMIHDNWKEEWQVRNVQAVISHNQHKHRTENRQWKIKQQRKETINYDKVFSLFSTNTFFFWSKLTLTKIASSSSNQDTKNNFSLKFWMSW